MSALDKIRKLPLEYAEPIRSSLAHKIAVIIRDLQEQEGQILECVHLAKHLCEGCRRKEKFTNPPRSGVVGSMAGTLQRTDLHCGNVVCGIRFRGAKK